MNDHTASMEITVNVHESVLSRKLVFWTSNWKHVIKYDLYVKLSRIFAHNVQMCAKFCCKKFQWCLPSISNTKPLYLGAFFRGHAVVTSINHTHGHLSRCTWRRWYRTPCRLHKPWPAAVVSGMTLDGCRLSTCKPNSVLTRLYVQTSHQTPYRSFPVSAPERCRNRSDPFHDRISQKAGKLYEKNVLKNTKRIRGFTTTRSRPTC